MVQIQYNMDEEGLLGNQAKPIPPPEQVTQAARKIKYLVTELIPLQVKESHLTNPKSRIITNKVLDLCERAASESGVAGCVVYACLYCAQFFHRLCLSDIPDSDIHVLRAVACEVIAKRLLERQDDEEFVYSEALLRRYQIIRNGRKSDPKSAIELAVDYHITRVVAAGPYNNAMNKIWAGDYLVKYAEDESLQFQQSVHRHNHNFWDHFKVSRCNIPRYQNILQIFLSLVFLGLYTGTVNTANDNGDMDAVEVLMFLFVFGYLCDEALKIMKVGRAYVGFWNTLNLTMYVIFAGAIGLRFAAFSLSQDSEMRTHLVVISYQILSSAAPLMWIRMLLYLDIYRFFGVLMVVTQEMLKESLVFVALLVVIVIGFLQAFIGFDSADGRLDLAVKILHTVVQSTLGSPVFEVYEGSFALILYYIFTFVISVVLLNILIALFNQAYSNVYENAGDEYLWLFARKTLQFVRAPDENVFIPPFNLIEIFLLVPFELILSKQTYAKVNKLVLTVLYAPYLLCIATYEYFIHKPKKSAHHGDFEDDHLIDEDEDEHVREWAEVCKEELPSAESDMEVLEELRKRLKSLEEMMKK